MFRRSLTDRSIPDSGAKTKLMDKVNYSMLTRTHMRDSFKMTKHMDLEHTSTPTDHTIRANG